MDSFSKIASPSGSWHCGQAPRIPACCWSCCEPEVCVCKASVQGEEWEVLSSLCDLMCTFIVVSVTTEVCRECGGRVAAGLKLLLLDSRSHL